MGVFNARSHPAAPGRGCVTPLVAKFGAHQRRVFGARMCSSETISSKKPKESSVCESRLEFLHSLGRNTTVPVAQREPIGRANSGPKYCTLASVLDMEPVSSDVTS